MPSHVQPVLSLFEKVSLFAGLISYAISWSSCYPRLKCIVTDEQNPVPPFIFNLIRVGYNTIRVWPIKRVLAISLVRILRPTLRQRHYIDAPTGQSLQQWCSASGIALRSETIDCAPVAPPATLHTFDIPDATGNKNLVFFYLHGGAYIFPLNASAAMPFFVERAKTAGATQFVVLEYTLAPELRYPGQLAQAAAALDHLINVQGVPPSQILLTGESAGGHLALSLLAHVQQPHPKIKAVQGLSRAEKPSLKGVCLLSPYIGMDASAPSYVENQSTDMLTATDVHFFTDAFRPLPEPWGQLALAGPDVWKGLPADKVLISVGMWEVFRDDVYKVVEAMEAAGINLTFVKGANEAHVQSALDYMLGLPRSGSTIQILKWLGSV